jgi:hypothetical protein
VLLTVWSCACPSCELQLFLEKNEVEAEVMAVKEEKAKEIEKSTIKVGAAAGNMMCLSGRPLGGGDSKWQLTNE